MSNINEILRKAECFQEDDVSDSAIDSNEQYRLGRICYSMKSFDDAEYWWEQAARNHHVQAKQALLSLYRKELRNKYNSSGRMSFNEAKGRRWPVSTGNCEVELYCVRL